MLPRGRHAAVIAATSKEIPRRPSRREFNLAGANLYFASQVERRCIVEIVLVQMVVTAVLLVGFTVEVLLGRV